MELDREWEEYRAQYLSWNDNGEYDVPDPEACRTGLWLSLGFGACAALLSAYLGPPELAILVVLAAVGVVVPLRRQEQVGRMYQRSLKNYHTARRAAWRAGDVPAPGGAGGHATGATRSYEDAT